MWYCNSEVRYYYYYFVVFVIVVFIAVPLILQGPRPPKPLTVTSRHHAGGAFIAGHPLQWLPALRHLLQSLRLRSVEASVFSVRYPLGSPHEATFPAALMHIHETYTWLGWQTQLSSSPEQPGEVKVILGRCGCARMPRGGLRGCVHVHACPGGPAGLCALITVCMARSPRSCVHMRPRHLLQCACLMSHTQLDAGRQAGERACWLLHARA